MNIRREVYLPHPRPGTAVNMSTYYIGSGLDKVEIHSLEHEGRNDLPVDPMVRYSPDNGRTWSDFEPLPEIVTFGEGSTFYWGGSAPFYDPVSGLSVSIWLRQTIVAEPLRYHCHCFSRVSDDFGRTWGEARMIRYEDGPEFNPDNPLDPNFLTSNNSYPGNNFICHSSGYILQSLTSINVPDYVVNTDPDGTHGNWWSPSGARDIGSACFTGTWNPDIRNYDWTCGERIWVPMSVSSRGLMEAETAELKDGRIVVIWRASNTPETPGRKWFSVSTDGGRRMSSIQDLRYDDGTQFYSPSSYHKLFRHSITNKLYWIGNICPEPPDGNSPRYPLIIAEVDEAIPSIKRSTVTIIDDRNPDDSVDLALSNFNVLENRETHDLELSFTRLGTKASYADDPDRFWEADHYKYTITL